MTNVRKTPIACALTLAVMIFGAIEPAHAEPNTISADDRIAACKRHPTRCTIYVDANGTLIFTGSGNMWDCPPKKKYCTLVPK